MQDCFEAEDLGGAALLARQMTLLLDGCFAVSLLHRDPSYMETAGDTAYALVKAAAATKRITAGRHRRTLRNARAKPPAARA
jgi:hypothetical protein